MKTTTIDMSRVGTSWKDLEVGDTVVLRNGSKEVVISVQLQTGDNVRFSKNPVVLETDAGVSYFDEDLNYAAEESKYDVVEILKAPVPMYTSVHAGDTVQMRNGAKWEVKEVTIVKPSTQYPNNPVRIDYTDGTYGLYTENLDLVTDIESPLDILHIYMGSAALVGEIYNGE